MTNKYYSIHNFSCCFADNELPQNGITYDWIFENLSDFVEHVVTLDNGGCCSVDKWDVIRQFTTNEFYPHAIIDDTVCGDYDGDTDVNCTAIEFWMVAENDNVFYPMLLSDLDYPEK